MNLFKKYLFSLFEKSDKNKENEEKENKKPGNELAQPSTPNDNEKKKTNKKLIIKILVWLSIVLVIGIIIGVSIYFSQDHSKDLSTYNAKYQKNLDVSVNGKTKKIDALVFDTNGDGNYYESQSSTDIVIDVSTVNSILKSTFYGSANKWLVHANTTLNTQVRFIIMNNPDTSTFYFNNSYFVIETKNETNPEVVVNENYNNNQYINSNDRFASWLRYTQATAVVASGGFDWMSLLSLLFPIALIVLMVYFYSKMLKGSGQASLFGQKDNTYSKVTNVNVKFDDVAGIDEVKNELKEVVDYLKQPQKYLAMGARIPKGLILYGPPGTGKTLIAKAVAGEAHVPFFQANGASFDDMFVGSGARRVRDLFQKASKEAPSIIFIDEIDAVASKRGSNAMMGGGIADQTINELLSQMDGFTQRENVIVIAATNRIDTLDPAILRPGRFDLQIQVVLPDIDGREAILKIHARNKNLASNVNLRDIARRTAGFSGAQLEDVLNEATLLAVRENRTSISVQNIDEAIDRVIGGPKRENRVISDEEKMQIAYHEAGHALVGLHNNAGEIVEKITIIPRGQAAGYTMQTPQDKERMIPRKKDMIALIQMALGGRASEEIIFGADSVSAGASNDLYKVTNIARSMVASYGMGDIGLTQFVASEGQPNQFKNDYSDHIAYEIDKNVSNIIRDNYGKTCNVIQSNKHELELIVITLLVLETIIKSQIDYIHEHKKLPQEVFEHENDLVSAIELLAKAPINKDDIDFVENYKKEFGINSTSFNNDEETSNE